MYRSCQYSSVPLSGSYFPSESQVSAGYPLWAHPDSSQGPVILRLDVSDWNHWMGDEEDERTELHYDLLPLFGILRVRIRPAIKMD